LWEYFDWSNDEITVTAASDGYVVEADYPMGAHLKFKIGRSGDRFSDISDVSLTVGYDSSKNLTTGRLKLDSSSEKSLLWKGTYQGNEISVACRLK
ncbi:MAG: hypothetical protein IJP39_10205, partial [Bacteroidales bacterium]|nr:hypothetical protein [Bacteroidales bacterium]